MATPTATVHFALTHDQLPGNFPYPKFPAKPPQVEAGNVSYMDNGWVRLQMIPESGSNNPDEWTTVDLPPSSVACIIWK